MAQRIMKRRELRVQAEIAETKKDRKIVLQNKPTRSRRKPKINARMRAYWGVFDQKFKQVALFEYRQRDEADRKAKELRTKKNKEHFVQMVKEEITE